MTPQEKAKELFDKFYPFRNSDANALMHYNAKQCALIVVEEILNVRLNSDFDGHMCDEIGAGDYWDEVKQEIEKL